MNSTAMSGAAVRFSPSQLDLRGGPFDGASSLSERIRHLHRVIRGLEGLSAIQRISVALYDPSTDMLKTFLHSDVSGSGPFEHHQAPLSSLASLKHAADHGHYRVTPSVALAVPGTSAHTRKLYKSGIRSSLAVPFYDQSALLGFVFFDADVADFFDRGVPERLWPYAHLMSLAITNELGAVRVARAAAKTAQEMARYRDTETATHLERMAHFARLIAHGLAPERGLTDDFVEYIFWFAPLHDIGKVGVPDAILLKPGKLDAVEFAHMQRHVEIGVEIVDVITRQFGLEGRPHVEVLRNIVAGHHENIDGSGYPAGRAGDDIPLEARITTTADVFDALTSVRPYKQRWSNDAAFAYMRERIGRQFDGACVHALAAHVGEIERIQACFVDDLPI